MRITLEIDDDLLETAIAYTEITDTTALLHEALKVLIQREAARPLAALGGSDPHAKAAPRRRPK